MTGHGNLLPARQPTAVDMHDERQSFLRRLLRKIQIKPLRFVTTRNVRDVLLHPNSGGRSEGLGDDWETLGKGRAADK
jgi:hypothetical protein